MILASGTFANEWDNFFEYITSAAAAILALTFASLQIRAPLWRADPLRRTSAVFALVELATPVFFGLIVLMPSHNWRLAGAITGALGYLVIAYQLTTIIPAWRDADTFDRRQVFLVWLPLATFSVLLWVPNLQWKSSICLWMIFSGLTEAWWFLGTADREGSIDSTGAATSLRSRTSRGAVRRSSRTNLPRRASRDDEDDRLTLYWGLRAVCGLAGAADLTFGTLAIFKTSLEAGPVALLATGLIFAIIAIAGQVPWRIKFGDTEIELQKERTQRKKADAAAVDLAGAVRPTEQPQAVEVVERTQATNPALGAAMRRALGYEQMVTEMISRIIARKAATWVPPDQLLQAADTSKTPSYQPTLFDGLIARADGVTRRALVEIKATTRDVDVGFINVLHDRFVRGVNQYGAEMLLLVTREPLSRTAGMRMAEFTDKRWVQVSGPADEEALDKTIDQLIGKLYWETSDPN